MSGVIWCWFFCDGLLSLSITSLRLVHVVADCRISFLFKARRLCVACMGHGRFIHSSIRGHQGCFHPLADVNHAAMGMVCKGLWVPVSSSFQDTPGVRLLGHMVILCLIFQGSATLLSTAAAPSCSPTPACRAPAAPILPTHAALWFGWWC